MAVPPPTEMLLSRMLEGRCVPFLGAGANVASQKRNYEGCILGGELAKELAREVKPVPKDRHNLARVSLLYERRNDRPYLIRNLKKFIPDRDRQPSPLLNTIARLPFQLIVTTNYDRLLEEALKKRQKSYLTIIQTSKGVDGAPTIEEWTRIPVKERPILIYKIHGSFLEETRTVEGASEDRSPVIITEDDYIDFLSVMGKEELSLPLVVRQTLAVSTLLFLGYGLEDWDFRVIFKSLKTELPKNQNRKSIAIQRDSSRLWRDFWIKQDVDIYDMDIYDFSDLLEKTFLALSADGAGAEGMNGR